MIVDRLLSPRLALLLGVLALPMPLLAQHGAHGHHAGAPTPALTGQDAFAAIAEVVRLLQTDPATDWATVDLERLRRHLVDMHEVTLNARASRTDIAGGARFVVQGDGRTRAAVRRILLAHAPQLDAMPGYVARAEPTAGGAVLTVTGEEPGQAAKIRALGLVGLLALGAHHAPHHLALARGVTPAGHEHDTAH